MILLHRVSGRQSFLPSQGRSFYYMYGRVLIKHMSDFFMRLKHCEFRTHAGAQVRDLCLFLHSFTIEVQKVHLRALESQASSPY